MSLGPASKGLANPTPYSDSDESREGADYRNLLSRWVAEHAYYPEQARRDGEEGDAKVHVLAAPDGRVKEVELIGKSGSMWLDLALLSLFRDQHIPPYPGGGSEPIEFNFTMHYVLIRRSGGFGQHQAPARNRSNRHRGVNVLHRLGQGDPGEAGRHFPPGALEQGCAAQHDPQPRWRHP